MEDLGATWADDETTTGTGIVDVYLLDHSCTRNYDGSSGAMDSYGLLLMTMKVYKKYNGEIFLDYVTIYNDTTMKSYIAHPKTRSNGRNNIGGNLHIHIPVPTWYTDLTHRSKSVTGLLFELTKGPESELRANTLDVFRMKTYYFYFIKKTDQKV